MIALSDFQVLQVEVYVFLFMCQSAYHFRSIKNYKLNKQTLLREGSDIQYILLPFLFKDVTTDFTHTCREQKVNLYTFFVYDIHTNCSLNCGCSCYLQSLSLSVFLCSTCGQLKALLKKSFQIPYHCIPSQSLLLFSQRDHSYVMFFEAMLQCIL